MTTTEQEQQQQYRKVNITTNEIASQHNNNINKITNERIMKKEFPTFDNSMYYTCQENAWMDERVMLMWVEKFLSLLLSQPQKVLFPYCCWILIVIM